MHELGITQEILEILLQNADDRKVTRVVLEIGKLSCVLPDAVQFCFELCAAGTLAEGAALEIVQPPGRGRCRKCNTELDMDAAFTRCGCGSCDLEWLSGEQLKIKLMEVA
jgi:hydrogenase nickel incorporation protein HypA/HybF